MTLTEALSRAGITATDDDREPATVEVYEPPYTTYSTNDEITFLRGLVHGHASSSNGVYCINGWAGKGANVEAFRRYAALVLSGLRTYGANVDVARVHAEIGTLMRLLCPVPTSHPAVLEENWDRTTEEDYGPKARERRQQARVA